MSIASRTSIREKPHRIALQNPGPPAPDGDGGYVQTWTDLAPAAVYARIQPATAENLERLSAGTVLSAATHIVTMTHHPQVTTATRILFNGRRFSVTGVDNPEELNVDTVARCVEVVA